ncbi:MAG TPA: hypothetical protein VMW52_09385 [Phycisphaerae bacterium]|nr:hypothetical protein [Phycisphaerae bacterium]
MPTASSITHRAARPIPRRRRCRPPRLIRKLRGLPLFEKIVLSLAAMLALWRLSCD